MSKRYGEWHLLGEGDDPVPGDAADIADEGRHYTSVARDIEAQVRVLRQLASDDQILKGEYAEGLRESCESAADDLDRAHGRFYSVGSALSAWAEDVRTARSETWAELQDAEQAQATIDANPPADPLPPGAEPRTPAQQDQVDRTDGRREGAQDALEAVRQRFDRTMQTYDGAAEDIARRIRDASDDDMKDSRWDKVKAWVDEHAEMLKLIADIIGWIVTIVAIVALFVTPVGWVLLLVAAVALVGVGIRFLLAASGNGSWTDFAIDLVGMLTLGTGKIATAFAKAGRAATLRLVGTAAGNQARAAAVSNALAAFKNASLLKKPGVWLFKSNPVMRWMAGRSAYTTTKLAWINKSLPEISRLDTVLAGMDDVAGAMRIEIKAINLQFPGLVTRGYDLGSKVAVNAGRTGAIFDFTDKILGDSFDGLKPGVPAYGDAKDTWSYQPGGHLW